MTTPTEAVDRYLEVLGPGTSPGYDRLAIVFGNYAEAHGGELNRQMVENYILERRRSGCAESTLRKEFDNIKRLFEASKLEWPFRKREGPDHYDHSRDRFMPTVGDVERLIKAATTLTPEHLAILALSTTYGCRRIEMSWYMDKRVGRWAGIGPGSFDWDTPTVFVETAKGGRKRHHLVPRQIIPVLQAYDWQPRTPNTVSHIFQEIRKAVGPAIPGVAYHGIRAKLTNIIEQARFTPSEMRTFMRWSTNSSMELRYASRKEVSMFGPPQGRLAMPTFDEELDRRVFSVNPWLSTWETIGRRLAAGHRRRGAA